MIIMPFLQEIAAMCALFMAKIRIVHTFTEIVCTNRKFDTNSTHQRRDNEHYLGSDRK